MAGGKQTPRQRMIGILYLVLLGLIALNVPDNLLDAFRKITISLDSSSANSTKDVKDTYTSFENSILKEQHDRALPIYTRAQAASKAAEDLNTYVQNLREFLVKEGGGINPNINDVDARDNLDISPRVMIDQKRADTLKEKIIATREALLAQLQPKDRESVLLSLNTEDPPPGTGEKKSWQEAFFGEGVPLGATLTNLAKIQTDVKNGENEVVKKILSEADKAVVTLDQFNGVAVAPTSYVIAGTPYTADIFLTAYDSKSNPNITINGSPIHVENGKGKYSVNTSTPGTFTYNGKIVVRGPNGDKTYDLPTQTYQVARPSAVVSPTKMNVLYIGLPNPLAISAPGVGKSDLRVTMDGGRISGSGDDFVANVTTPGNASVKVSAMVQGKETFLGTSVFRVKRIPDPKAEFAGKSGGRTSAANIRGQDRVFAILENFEFDARFKVTRFSLSILKPRQDVISYTATGNELTAQMKTAMNSVSPGTLVVIRDIIAVGPDGTQRGLEDIVLTAN
jgi:gliding motility-associated protein GldM